MPSAIFLQSAPARARNSAIATAIFLLLVVAGFVQAAGDAEWTAGARQVNDALRQMRQQAHGVPGAMQYVNLAEKLWKQAQEQWAMNLRYQQQSRVDHMRTQLLAQQQNLMNQLVKQQQFLQQQLAAWKTPELKTIDPFGDYRAHGVSLHPKDGRLHGPGTIADTPGLLGLFRQPDMNEKEGPGMESWKEAMRQLDSISSASASFPAPPAAPFQTPGSWDNPLAESATVRPLGSGTPSLADSEYQALSDQTRGNIYAEMSPGVLRTLSEQYPNNVEIKNAITALIASQETYKNLSDISEDAAAHEYWMNRKMGEGSKAAVHAGAVATELVSGYPAVLAEKVITQDRDGARGEVVSNLGETALEEGMERIPLLEPFTPGVAIVSKGMLAKEFLDSVTDAVNHYDSASESFGYTKATGGSGPALAKAEKARQDMLLRSKKLYDLIAAQEALNKGGINSSGAPPLPTGPHIRTTVPSPP